MFKILVINALLILLFMTLCFFAARRRKRLDTVDIAWGLGFVIVAWSVVIQQPVTRSYVIAILVSVWGLRLANHIYQRSKGNDDDPRYKELSRKWKGDVWKQAYKSVFLLQGALIWVVSLPIVTAANEQLDGYDWLTLLGAAIWLVGFSIEAVADRQLATFLRQTFHSSVLQTGLWRYSRHPNYFGELVQWWGIAIIALQASQGWLGLIGPLVLSYLIIYVSGIPPIEKRREDDPDYQRYKRHTSALIPMPPY